MCPALLIEQVSGMRSHFLVTFPSGCVHVQSGMLHL